MEDRPNHIEKAHEPEQEPTEEFQIMIREGIESISENYELFQMDNVTPMDISPFSFSAIFNFDQSGNPDDIGGKDERVFSDLSDSERKFVREELQKYFGFQLNPDNVRRTYFADSVKSSTWDGRAGGSVYGTDELVESDMLLHHWYYPDGREGYMLAPMNFEYSEDEKSDQGGEDEL